MTHKAWVEDKELVYMEDLVAEHHIEMEYIVMVEQLLLDKVIMVVI